MVEQVSSDGHQMSPAGMFPVQWCSLPRGGGLCQSHGGEGPCPVRSLVQGVGRGSLSSEIYAWRGSQARVGLGPGGLYSEVQCIMDNGHRLTDGYTHYLPATSLAGDYKAFTDTLINWCTLIFVWYIYEENYMRYVWGRFGFRSKATYVRMTNLSTQVAPCRPTDLRDFIVGLPLLLPHCF